jgi:hypothetical protein
MYLRSMATVFVSNQLSASCQVEIDPRFKAWTLAPASKGSRVLNCFVERTSCSPNALASVGTVTLRTIQLHYSVDLGINDYRDHDVSGIFAEILMGLPRSTPRHRP